MANDIPPAGQWVKCISTQGNIRGVALEVTGLVREMAARHHLRGLAARGLGETVMGALLIASYCKRGERINLNIQGTGYFQQALVDAYPEGHVRGYIIERESVISGNDSSGPWGTGLLSVLRTKDEEGGKPYIGTVPLLTGYLAKDLSFYWVQSEQIPSAVGLAVHLRNEEVISAAGFLVQALPGASVTEIKLIEQHIKEIENFGEVFRENILPLTLLSQVFQSTPFLVVEERNLEFKCNCSWERVQRALVLVGTVELQSMLAEEQEAVVRCDFCAKEYCVDAATLEKLIQSKS